MIKNILLASALAMTAIPAYAAPEPYRAICIIWNDRGEQVFGEGCFVHEWATAFAVSDARSDNPYVATVFDIFLDDDAAPGPVWGVDGVVVNKQLNVRWTNRDSVWYWPNGNMAFSIEEDESELGE